MVLEQGGVNSTVIRHATHMVLCTGLGFTVSWTMDLAFPPRRNPHVPGSIHTVLPLRRFAAHCTRPRYCPYAAYP